MLIVTKLLKIITQSISFVSQIMSSMYLNTINKRTAGLFTIASHIIGLRHVNYENMSRYGCWLDYEYNIIVHKT
jgi:hypothetical protein